MHKASGNWRVVVPARWSGTGKRHHRYFDTKGAAERFIAETLAARHTDVSFRNVKMNNHKVCSNLWRKRPRILAKRTLSCCSFSSRTNSRCGVNRSAARYRALDSCATNMATELFSVSRIARELGVDYRTIYRLEMIDLLQPEVLVDGRAAYSLADAKKALAIET